MVRGIAVTPIVPSTKQRRPYRAPLGMPKGGGREDWRIASWVSFGVHLGILILMLAPLGLTAEIHLREQGAGGPGPAGGGGGGNRGTHGFTAELLRYVRLAPPPAPASPAIEVPPPLPPEAELTPTLPQIEPPKIAELTPAAGIGGGTGAHIAGGMGPGSGGGVGSGVGTGTGSATGPGTGGGTQANYPPTAIEMFIPPLPVPAAARGFHLIAEFDVDETGKVRGLEFTPTRDRGYNRRLREVLEGFRFRPGTRADGTPIRMKYQLTIDLP